jgi:hypothetical protein
MLLNSDIQKKNCSNDLHFQKKINVIMYIIEKWTQIISFWQNLGKIWIFKVYVFVMFKINYLINRMQCIILSQQMRWLDGKVACFHFKGQGIKTHKWCVRGQQWEVDHIFSYIAPYNKPRLIM